MAFLLVSLCGNAPAAEPVYHSALDVAYSPDGRLLAVSDRTANALVLIDTASKKVKNTVALKGRAGMLTWAPDGSRVFIVEYENSSVAEVTVADGKIARHIPAGNKPMDVALAAKSGLLLVTNTGLHDVSVIDLASGAEKTRVKTVREPWWIALTPDESLAAVGNLLPAGSAADPAITACVSLIDLKKFDRVDVKLPPNTTSIREVTISPDGRWAYAVHTVGRTTLPATQLDRGWVNTNALSFIDLTTKQLYATVLLDSVSEGAADPWGIALSKDGGTMWITLAGAQQLAKIELAELHKNLQGASASQGQPATPAPPANPPAKKLKKGEKAPPPPPPAPAPAVNVRTYPASSIWLAIKADATKRAELVNDLSALWVAGVLNRTPLPGKGPRGVSLSPDGKTLAIAVYFNGQILLVDAENSRVCATIDLGAQPELTLARRGEIIFHDGTYSFQHWLSCATCHPNDGRADGLNWDLPNDGIGNPKSAKSLLFSQETKPAMWLGVRDSMEAAAMAGFRFAALQPPQQDVDAVQAYIRSLTPEVSPYRLPNGDMSDKAKRGKALFESQDTGCAHCHSGPVFTQGKKVDVGTQGPLDHKDETAFVTPPLVELWRTAPYLHDGRATTIQEIFSKYNKGDAHGTTSKLTPAQLDDLAEYLLSLP